MTKTNPDPTFVSAGSEEAFAIGRTLFRAYANDLDFDLSFQDFETELKTIQQQYTPPEGSLVLTFIDDRIAGCFGIRKLENEICELKRMYIKPEFRGQGIGWKMMAKSLDTARILGYQKMRLDTLPSMKAAISLYDKAGFYEIQPYRHNPFPDAKYMEVVLT